MACSPLSSVVVRRTFAELDSACEDAFARPRADTDTCVDYSEYSCDQSADDCQKDGSDVRSSTATMPGDGLSWADSSDDDWCESDVEQSAVPARPPGAFQVIDAACQMQYPAYFMMRSMAASPSREPVAESRSRQPAAKAAKVKHGAADSDSARVLEGQTTAVILRKLPKDISSIQVRAMLDCEFRNLYDFLYVPINFKSACNLGYALINFTSFEHAAAAVALLNGCHMGSSALAAELSSKHSGLASLIEQYQGSHVITDETLPDQYKPMLFKNGKVVRFPGSDVDAED